MKNTAGEGGVLDGVLRLLSCRECAELTHNDGTDVSADDKLLTPSELVTFNEQR
ncbi:hypothetical protein SAMN02787076_01206 [Rhizobacter sp. OV335]|jgi:hypothetical protein|nr:hypothetical protein SAMN02787076_01206 [Rhizobacter sp. OV335]